MFSWANWSNLGVFFDWFRWLQDRRWQEKWQAFRHLGARCWFDSVPRFSMFAFGWRASMHCVTFDQIIPNRKELWNLRFISLSRFWVSDFVASSHFSIPWRLPSRGAGCRCVRCPAWAATTPRLRGIALGVVVCEFGEVVLEAETCRQIVMLQAIGWHRVFSPAPRLKMWSLVVLDRWERKPWTSVVGGVRTKGGKTKRNFTPN